MPRLARRRASASGRPAPGLSFSIVRPVASKCTTSGPYSSDTQKVPSFSNANPSLSMPSGSCVSGAQSSVTGISVRFACAFGCGSPVSVVPLACLRVMVSSSVSVFPARRNLPICGANVGTPKPSPVTPPQVTATFAPRSVRL